MSKEGAERTKWLDTAVREIQLTQRLYDLGGEKWEAKYDALLRQIQKAKGERPVGLQALESDKKESAAKTKQ
jgi:hypothetical protein